MTTEDALLDQYLIEVRMHPLLTAEDEGRLGKMIRDGESAAEELASGEKRTPAQRRALDRQIRAGQQAKRQFIQSNLRLVISIAHRYRGSGLSLGDLVQEGNLGLIRAVDHFDHRKGFKFSTYATWWIRQSLSKALADTGATIRIPAHIGDVQTRIAKTESELFCRLGRPPTLDELSSASGLTIEKITSIRSRAPRTVSLSTTIGSEGDGGELEDIIADETAADPFDVAATEMGRLQVADALKGLNSREQEVLNLRFGLDGSNPLTLDQVSARFDVTRERVRQIEAKALSKLRHPCMPPALRRLFDAVA